jgi:phospholipid/cholesterol/gamma-HCH transport system substrate-binding protein
MFKGDRNFAVGLFVSIAIASFIFFVIWLTGRTGQQELTRYTLLFHKDVSGLSVGGPVKYMGMNVGSVITMDLERIEDLEQKEDSEENKAVKIRVDIDVLESTPVDQGTFASLALQGITGVAVVNLESESGRHSQLDVLQGRDYPVIPVKIVGFSALMTSAPKIISKLNSLLTQAGKILGEQNQKAIADTLANINALTTSIAEERATIAAIPGNLNATIRDIQVTVLQLQGMITELQPGINSTIDNVNQSSKNLASLTGRVDTMLQDHEDDISQFMQDGLAEVPALMNETRQALRDLEKLVQELQDDPSQIIYKHAENSVEIEP